VLQLSRRACVTFVPPAGDITPACPVPFTYLVVCVGVATEQARILAGIGDTEPAATKFMAVDTDGTFAHGDKATDNGAGGRTLDSNLIADDGVGSASSDSSEAISGGAGGRRKHGRGDAPPADAGAPQPTGCAKGCCRPSCCTTLAKATELHISCPTCAAGSAVWRMIASSRGGGCYARYYGSCPDCFTAPCRRTPTCTAADTAAVAEDGVVHDDL
jgi:hypothetical protein